MAKEILPIREEILIEVIEVILVGLHTLEPLVRSDVKEFLTVWCHEYQDYGKEMSRRNEL